MQIYGTLRVSPTLEWEDLRSSRYIPFELHRMQGRNSAMSSQLHADIKERLVSDVEGVSGHVAFVKYAESFFFDPTSSRFAHSVSEVASWVRQAIEAFPDHVFDGLVRLEEGKQEWIILVEDNAITVKEKRSLWVPTDTPHGTELPDPNALAEAVRLLEGLFKSRMLTGLPQAADVEAFLMKYGIGRSVDDLFD